MGWLIELIKIVGATEEMKIGITIDDIMRISRFNQPG